MRAYATASRAERHEYNEPGNPVRVGSTRATAPTVARGSRLVATVDRRVVTHRAATGVFGAGVTIIAVRSLSAAAIDRRVHTPTGFGALIGRTCVAVIARQ